MSTTNKRIVTVDKTDPYYNTIVKTSKPLEIITLQRVKATLVRRA